MLRQLNTSLAFQLINHATTAIMATKWLWVSYAPLVRTKTLSALFQSAALAKMVSVKTWPPSSIRAKSFLSIWVRFLLTMTIRASIIWSQLPNISKTIARKSRLFSLRTLILITLAPVSIFYLSLVRSFQFMLRRLPLAWLSVRCLSWAMYQKWITRSSIRLTTRKSSLLSIYLVNLFICCTRFQVTLRFYSVRQTATSCFLATGALRLIRWTRQPITIIWSILLILRELQFFWTNRPILIHQVHIRTANLTSVKIWVVLWITTHLVV